jgi:hypothetical protein
MKNKSLKKKKKRTQGRGQMVQHLPNKWKIRSSDPSTVKPFRAPQNKIEMTLQYSGAAAMEWGRAMPQT